MNRKPDKNKGKSKPPRPEGQKNLKKKVQFLKDKLKDCQEEKEYILNKKKIELKNKEDKIEELKYRLKQEQETPEATPEDTELVDDLQEENRELREENEELILENNRLEEQVEELEEEKKQLEKKVDQLKEENKRLLRELEKYKEDGAEIGFNLPSNAEIRGDIKSEEMIQVGNNVKVLGSLKSEKDIILGHENDVRGDIISEGGAVKVGNATEIGGFIRGKEVRLAESVKGGEVQADEKVMIEKNCSVLDVLALGDVDLGEDVVVEGSLRYAGDFDASKGVKITESVLPSSKEELEKKIEETLTEKPAFPPVILRGGTEGEIEKEEEGEEEISLRGKVEKKIDNVRSLMKSCRENDIDIVEERYLLSEGATLYKEENYEEAEEVLSECHDALDKKLNSEVDEEEKKEIEAKVEEETEEMEEMEVKEGDSLASLVDDLSTYEPESEEEQEEEEEEEQEEQEEQEEEEQEEEEQEEEEQEEEELEEEETLSKDEVIDELVDIKGIGPSMAERLYDGGFSSIEEIREASADDLQRVDGIGTAFSKKIKENVSVDA